MATRNTVIVIGGPTASGKTALAVSVAQHFRTEVISADSRQCYHEMNIGVARPSAHELQAVPHHFIATHSVWSPANAVIFENYALETCEHLFSKAGVVVMAGGTGLYLKAFCDGLDNIPGIPEDVRLGVRKEYEERGLLWLQHEVKKADPRYYASGEMDNPHRLLRALEVVRATGRSIIHFQKGENAIRPFDILRIALDVPKETLLENINQRVNHMIAAGLEDEVRALLHARHLPPLNTVGYAEMFAYVDGFIRHDEAVERIKISTRQYAKRQRTWFRSDERYHWMKPDATDVIKYAERVLASPAGGNENA